MTSTMLNERKPPKFVVLVVSPRTQSIAFVYGPYRSMKSANKAADTLREEKWKVVVHNLLGPI